ncbi:hypothetical protein MRX96_024005 [Rhipicephalus microplus]
MEGEGLPSHGSFKGWPAHSSLWLWLRDPATAFPRLVASLGLGGILNTTYTLSMEVLSARHRALGSLISTGGWTTGLLTLTGLAWLFRDWMIFQGVITVAAMGSVVNWFFIPESPRWLLAMGKYDQASEELEKAARKNKVTGVSVEAIIKQFKEKISLDKLATKPTFTALFRSRCIRMTSCLLSAKSVLDTLVYYNLTYSSILLGDPYLSFALVAVAEYPGRLLGVACVNYLHRRTAYIALYSFASLCSAAAIFVPAEASWALMVGALLAKIGLIAAHCVNVVQMSELYPTKLRTTAMGFTITTSRIGAILAPFTKELETVLEEAAKKKRAFGAKRKRKENKRNNDFEAKFEESFTKIEQLITVDIAAVTAMKQTVDVYEAENVNRIAYIE